jgi:hypothetical protein
MRAALLLSLAAALVVSGWGYIDARGRPSAAWKAAGHSQARWVAGIAVGTIVAFGPLIAVAYLIFIRPQLRAPQRGTASRKQGGVLLAGGICLALISLAGFFGVPSHSHGGETVDCGSVVHPRNDDFEVSADGSTCGSVRGQATAGLATLEFIAVGLLVAGTVRRVRGRRSDSEAVTAGADHDISITT